jgi:hypothetical protein
MGTSDGETTMKVSVATVPDFDFEIVDVVIRIEDDRGTSNCWSRGFDDDEWEAAEQYARDLAKVLGCEYIGEIAE